MKRIEQETSKFDEALEDQRDTLEQTERAMNEVISDMVANLKKEIDTERKDREENEETLMCLLENTCNKLTEFVGEKQD